MTTPAPLLVADLETHPEFPYVHWKLNPEQSGTIPVAEGRGGPFDIYWEVHGHGPTRLVFVMGLGAFINGWQWQTKYFGHTHASTYSVLAIDNRGVGNSGKPLMRYSTSEMARDLVEVLAHVGWTQERELHIAGISMGGMIAQELATLIPTRVASLTLLATAARLVNTVGFLENLSERVQLFMPRSLDKNIVRAKQTQFSATWVNAPDETEPVVQRFPSNGDRFAAFEVRKRQQPEKFTRKGFICQAIAAGWHHKSSEQLSQLADNISRRRIVVVHGTDDRMITYPHAGTLVADLNRGAKDGEEIKFVEMAGAGHVLIVERWAEINKIIEDVVERTSASR